MTSFEEINALTVTGAETFAFSQEDAERILCTSTNGLDNNPLAVEEMKTKLIHLKKKEIRSNLHSYTLSEYWRNKRIPQGLRIQKAPTIGKESKDFVQKWCEILNKCSMDLMLLIIEESTKQKADALRDVENHETLIRQKLGDNLTEFNDSIKQTLKSYEDGLMFHKIKKYKRDATDYQQGKVYNFLCTEEDAQPPPPPRRGQRGQRGQTAQHADTTTAESDFLTDSDSSWGYQRPAGNQQPKNDRGRGRARGRGRQGVDRRNPNTRPRPNTRQWAKFQL